MIFSLFLDTFEVSNFFLFVAKMVISLRTDQNAKLIKIVDTLGSRLTKACFDQHLLQKVLYFFYFSSQYSLFHVLLPSFGF